MKKFARIAASACAAASLVAVGFAGTASAAEEPAGQETKLRITANLVNDTDSRLDFRALSKSSQASWEKKPVKNISTTSRVDGAWSATSPVNASNTVSYWIAGTSLPNGDGRIGVVFDTWNIIGQLNKADCKFVRERDGKKIDVTDYKCSVVPLWTERDSGGYLQDPLTYPRIVWDLVVASK